MLSASLNKTFFSLSATFIVKITFVNFAPFVGTTHVCSNKPILNVCVSGQGASVAGMKEGRKEMFYLTTHSTHFIYGYMASDIWLRTILIVRKETRCRHICYSLRLSARVLLYAPSHRQDNTYHGLCYTSRRYWLEREIAQWVHPMKDRSDDPPHHERTLYL